MTELRRVVVDTSALVGAMLRPRSMPRQALMIAVNEFQLCTSNEMIEELIAVLHRRKFDKYLAIEARLDFLALVSSISYLCKVDHASNEMAKVLAETSEMTSYWR